MDYTSSQDQPSESILYVCSYHNARTKSLLFSMLEMLLTGSDCFHVISDCFDSFFRDLHACRHSPPPEICQVE